MCRAKIFSISNGSLPAFLHDFRSVIGSFLTTNHSREIWNLEYSISPTVIGYLREPITDRKSWRNAGRLPFDIENISARHICTRRWVGCYLKMVKRATLCYIDPPLAVVIQSCWKRLDVQCLFELNFPLLKLIIIVVTSIVVKIVTTASGGPI